MASYESAAAMLPVASPPGTEMDVVASSDVANAAVVASIMPDGKRPRTAQRLLSIGAKPLLHPHVTLEMICDGAKPLDELTIYMDDEPCRILSFICPGCNQSCSHSELAAQCLQKLTRRVQRGILQESALKGKGVVQCRNCRNRSQDEQPKTSLLNAVNRGVVAGSLQLSLHLDFSRRNPAAGSKLVSVKHVPLGGRMNQKAIEGALFAEAWQHLREVCGPEILVDESD